MTDILSINNAKSSRFTDSHYMDISSELRKDAVDTALSGVCMAGKPGAE